MSVNSIVAGTVFFGLKIPVSRSSRGSGTLEIPMTVSPLPEADQCGVQHAEKVLGLKTAIVARGW